MSPPSLPPPLPPPLRGRAWKLLGLFWLAGIFFYTLLVLFPVRFPLVDIPLAGTLTLAELLHFFAFLVLAGTFPLAFSSRILTLTAPVALVLLNIVLEFAQMHIPNRRFSEEDVAAGILGCLVGTVFGWAGRLSLRWREKQRMKKGPRPEDGGL